MKHAALALALAACSEPHDGTIAIAAGDCTTCHTPADDPHDETDFPILPADDPEMWHAEIACADCHHFDRGPGLRGFHVDCTETCHLQSEPAEGCVQYPQAMGLPCVAIEPEHLGWVSPIDHVTPYAWDKTDHDFCLTCHPAGKP